MLNDVTARALTAAIALGDAGPRPGGFGQRRRRGRQRLRPGSTGCRARWLVAEGGALEHDLAEPARGPARALADHHTAIVAPATASDQEHPAPRRGLLDVMQLSDIIEGVSPDTFERPIYAGNAIQTVQTADPVKVITVRTAAFAAASARAAPTAPIEAAFRRRRDPSRPCRASAARRWRPPTGRS